MTVVIPKILTARNNEFYQELGKNFQGVTFIWVIEARARVFEVQKRGKSLQEEVSVHVKDRNMQENA